MKLKLMCAFAVSLLGGCASVTPADSAQNTLRKTFPEPSRSMAGIFIYRNELMDPGVVSSIILDGQEIGKTSRMSFLYKEVTPGKHTLSTIPASDDATSTLHINVRRDTLSYVWQEVKASIPLGRSQLHAVDAGAGQEGVAQSTLAETR